LTQAQLDDQVGLFVSLLAWLGRPIQAEPSIDGPSWSPNMSQLSAFFPHPLGNTQPGTDGVAVQVLMREAMEDLHRLAHELTSTELDALLPLAMCMFAQCLGVTRIDWISPPTVRSLLSGNRHQMFEWLDDVFGDGQDIAALSQMGG
jgi:hypothetical protein